MPTSFELKEDMDVLNSVVRRLPRMAELAVQSQTKFNQSDEMILSFLQMISSSYQNVQVLINLNLFHRKSKIKRILLRFLMIAKK